MYVKKYVKIDISNGYYYEGLVLSTDENSITLKDKKNRLVTINNSDILNIRETSNGN